MIISLITNIMMARYYNDGKIFLYDIVTYYTYHLFRAAIHGKFAQFNMSFLEIRNFGRAKKTYTLSTLD